MSSSINIKLTDNSDLVKKAMQEDIDRALEMIGLKCEGYAKLLCPVDTGRLRNSLTHAPEGKSTEVIGTNVEYAPYVELGTRRHKAQPYLAPAVEDHINEYKNILETVLKSGGSP